MASIHKDPRGKSPFYYAAFYDSEGRRRFKSTKSTRRKEALAIAVRWEEAADRGRAGTLTTSQVRRVFNEILELVGDDPLDNFTARTWSAEWLAMKEGSRGKATRDRYAKPISDWLDTLGKRADLPLRAITPKDIRTFRDAESALGKAPLTVNLAHKALSAMFASAMRQGYVSTNPALGVDFLPEALESVEREVFSDDELKRLLAAAPSDDWKGVITLGFTTGARLGDLLRLTWGNVDLQKGVLSFTPAKTKRLGKKVEIPLHPQAEEFLLKHPAGQTNDSPVFPSLARLGIGGKSGASMAFTRIMAKAGIDRGTVKQARGAKGRTSCSKSFHSLRHSFISALSNAGVPVEIRQKFAAHSSAAQNLDYTHPDFKNLQQAISKLPSIK